MNDEVRVSVVQMEVVEDDIAQDLVERNLRRIDMELRRLTHEGPVDLVVFPELCTSGQVRQRDRAFGRKLMEMAQPIPGPLSDALSGLAKRYLTYLVVGCLEAHPEIAGVMYNSAVVISPDGSLVGVQRKVHIAGEEKHYFAAGNAIQVFETSVGKLSVGICYDAFFPEMARVQALRGAEILCLLFNAPRAANCGDMVSSVSRARAVENRLYVLSSSRTGGASNAAYIGDSVICDPLGCTMARAETEACALRGTLTGKRLLEERAYQPVLNDRRPELYSECVSLE